RARRCREAAALEPGQVLAHAVDLADIRAGADQEVRSVALLLEAKPVDRSRREGRAAAGDQADEHLVFADAPGELEQTRACRKARLVRRRMAGLYDLDVARVLSGGEAVAVARHDETASRRLPCRAERRGHRRGSLAGADHDGGSALLDLGERRAEADGRGGRAECGLERAREERLRV